MKRIVIEVSDESAAALAEVDTEFDTFAVQRFLALTDFEIVEDDSEQHVEAERKRIRGVLAGPLLETLRGIPRHQYLNGALVVDGLATRERMQRAWREAFPLTDEVAEHLREVLKGGQP